MLEEKLIFTIMTLKLIELLDQMMGQRTFHHKKDFVIHFIIVP
jgi:hypothetical protein